ncbi:MAG: nucleoside-diphosphate kinase [Alphaproteobacteria bacterium GM7ARS4]|nr:nucleoside-diphosphate kinase [Alphaproteobacteria bacterium GM7ARS4]
MTKRTPERTHERTLCIIKPDAVLRNFQESITKDIRERGYTIVKDARLTLTRQQAEEFYGEHKDRPFFDSLCSFMTSHDIIVYVLEKENAVQAWRQDIGNTDPTTEKRETLRKRYGFSKESNALHGSDSLENAQREIAFFFPAKARP